MPDDDLGAKAPVRRDPKTSTNMGSGQIIGGSSTCEEVEYWEWRNETFDTRTVRHHADNAWLAIATGGLSLAFGTFEEEQERQRQYKHHWVVNSCNPTSIKREWDTDETITPWLTKGGSEMWRFHWQSEPDKEANEKWKEGVDWANEHVAPGVGYTHTIDIGGSDSNDGPSSVNPDNSVRDSDQVDSSMIAGDSIGAMTIAGYGDPDLNGEELYDIRARSGNWNEFKYNIIPKGTTMTGKEWKSLIKVWWEQVPGQSSAPIDMQDDKLYTVEKSVWKADLTSGKYDHDNNPLTAEISYGYYLTWFKEVYQHSSSN